jgi:hypothetical protein
MEDVDNAEILEMKTVCAYSMKIKNKQKITKIAEERGKNKQSEVVNDMVEDYNGK